MSPPPLYIYMAQRTLFLQTRDWQWGQMCWGMAAQSRISIKTVWDASTAKRSNNWARLCQQFTPAQHCATNTSIPALLSCQQKLPMGWFTQLPRHILQLAMNFSLNNLIKYWTCWFKLGCVGLNLRCVGVTPEIPSQIRLLSSSPLKKKHNQNRYFEEPLVWSW